MPCWGDALEYVMKDILNVSILVDKKVKLPQNRRLRDLVSRKVLMTECGKQICSGLWKIGRAEIYI